MNQDIVAISNSLTSDQIELIKRTICIGASDDELRLFVGICNQTQLNPFTRQIFAIKRWDSSQKKNIMSTQVSIDGLRLVAERTGKYQGQVGPFWYDGNQWLDVWIKDSLPLAARVGVWREGFKEPVWGVAKFNSYVQRTKEGAITRMWATMPEIMIAKCAEASALRKSFPQETSGLYTDDEVPIEKEVSIEPEQNRQPVVIPKPDYAAMKVAIQQKEPTVFAPNPMLRLQEAAKTYAWSGEQMRIFMQSRFGKLLVKELTEKEIALLCEIMSSQSHSQAMEALKDNIK